MLVLYPAPQAGLPYVLGMTLKLCGPASFTDARGAAVSLPAKCLALLAYLSLEPGSHPRDELRTLLWGDSPDEKANASLRQALTRLRVALGDDLLVDRATVAIAAGLASDVSTFLRLADAGDEGALAIDVPR